MSDILVIIPAYNEERAIAQVIVGIQNAMPGRPDILVVNDGSCDETASRASAAGAVVVSHIRNMGYGVAIQTGYKYAYSRGYEFVVQIDGDGQHDPSYISQLLQPVVDGTADLALGSRFLDAGSYRPSFSRRAGMFFFSFLLSRLIGQAISDPTTGFQAFNAKVVAFFIGDSFPCDYPDADVLLVLGLSGFSICEVPVRMFARADGKSMHSGMKPLYYVFKMMLSMMVTLFRSRTEPHPGR
ncbi:MAG TPA: glycosyltransferase family 2 protein [Desulfuromonadales bacterium]|nr:glycosyltransferase family 2 protein [Desulfuromonadales bacterium]